MSIANHIKTELNLPAFAGQSAHWMMHAGQWVIVRRQLGKEAMF